MALRRCTEVVQYMCQSGSTNVVRICARTERSDYHCKGRENPLEHLIPVLESSCTAYQSLPPRKGIGCSRRAKLSMQLGFLDTQHF